MSTCRLRDYPTSANSPNITGFAVLTTFAVCATVFEKRGQFGTKVGLHLCLDYEIVWCRKESESYWTKGIDNIRCLCYNTYR